MEIILKRTVENLGDAGEIVDVKPGYARNYLIPQGLALRATASNRRRLEEERRHSLRAEERAKEKADELAQRIEGRSLTFTVLAGEEGKLFGSVTSADIAEELEGEGVTVDRRKIVLEEPIKELGVYRVPVDLHPEVRPEVKVWVVAEE